MCRPGPGITPTEANRPHSDNGGIHGAVSPEGAGQGRIAVSSFDERPMRYLSDPRRSERIERPRSLGENDRVQISHVALDVKGSDLPIPSRRLFETPDQAIHDKAGVIQPFTQVNEISGGLNILKRHRQVEHGLLLLVVQ